MYVENISLANQMMDNREESNNDIIREVIGILRNGNNKLIQLMGNDQLHNEELLSNVLAITEDINRTMIRWEYFSIGNKPEPFLSVFVENNAKQDAQQQYKHQHHQQQQQPQLNEPKVNQNRYQPQQKTNSLHDDLIDIFEDSQPSKSHPLDMFASDDDDDDQQHCNLRSEQINHMPPPQQQFDMFQGYPQEPSHNQQPQYFPQHPGNNNMHNNQMNFNPWEKDYNANQQFPSNQFQNFSHQQ